MPGDVPLAWKQLTRDKKRFTTALAGVSFGVVIMLFQVGIYQAFMRMVIRPVNALQGELVMVSPDFLYLMSAGEFPERRLYQALADSDVKSVFPVALSYRKWSNPSSRIKTEIALMGVHASENPFLIPEVSSRSDILASPEDLLFDIESTSDCGDIDSLFHGQGEVRTEINGSRVRVGGLFSMGQTLAAYGHVIMGMET
jgi:putative ABC transport system permease protein